MRTIKTYTLGCKTNFYESEAVAELFRQNNYVVQENEIADIYLINTCAVTGEAGRKSRQVIRRCKRLNPESVVVVMGCYAQFAGEDIEADVVIGTLSRGELVKMVEKFIEDRARIVFFKDPRSEVNFEELPQALLHGRSRINIKIQDGCDNFCAYCAIPYVRGRSRSRPVKNIVEEAKKLGQLGFLEIVLTGINISLYGKEFGVDVLDLVELISDVSDIKNIRLGSIEPTIVSDEFVRRAQRIKKLCPHFHLSLQSGSDSVLKDMNRGYSTDKFRESVFILRNGIPDVAITTDLIVGFPGETEQDFLNTYDFVKEMGFMKVHVFCYSAREGTKAALMGYQVGSEQKKERMGQILKLSKRLKEEFCSRYIGRELEIVPGKIIKGESCYGVTLNYMDIYATGNARNVVMKVKVDKFENDILKARIQPE